MRSAAIAFVLALFIGAAHAQAKVLRIAHQSIGADAIDPAQLNSVLVAHLMDNVLEPMLRYDYLARPLKLIANTLEALPEVGEGGRKTSGAPPHESVMGIHVAVEGHLTVAGHGRRRFSSWVLREQGVT